MSDKRKELQFSGRELEEILKKTTFNIKKAQKVAAYLEELKPLQEELVNLQASVLAKRERVIIIFEGRDASGKGGSISRFTEYLNPRQMRIVALPKPDETERGQWYFQRYIQHLPNAGEIVFFDRSWYNRAVVEPVMGFCTQNQYEHFMRQVIDFEKLLIDDGIKIIKFWFGVSKEEQLKRFLARKTNPLKMWKYSPVDEQAQELWEEYSKYKNKMLERTSTDFAPWTLVQTDSKRQARLESIRWVLNTIPYQNAKHVVKKNDPDVIFNFHKGCYHID